MLDSDLIRFLAENIGRLEPFDYFLIVLVGALIGFGAYFIVRSIYRQVIAAQEKLITIKDKTIEHHEKTLSSLESDKAKLESAFAHAAGQLEQLRAQLQTKDQESNRKVNALVKRFGVLIRLVMLARVGILELNIMHAYRVRASMLARFVRYVPPAEYRSPTDIAKGLDDLMQQTFDVLDVLRIYKDDGNELALPEEVPESLFQMIMVDVHKARIALRTDLHKTEPIIGDHMDKLVKQLQSQQPQG
jgi:hypothetical protein